MVGTPCVATPIAAEGMTLGERFGGLIVEDLEKYPTQVAALYTDQAAWNTAQESGREILSALFSEAQNTKALQERLTTLRQERERHRERNIVGALLWYHGLRSTEYFSRWIECKNRKS
jgi:hypothetical protein